MAMEGGENLPIEISSDSSDDEDAIFIDWEVTLTRHKASGSQCLGIPARVVRACLMHRPLTLEIEIDCDYQRLEDWELKWTHDRPTQCMFGHGWYEFAKEKNLREGDIVSFLKHPNMLCFLLLITRVEEQ